MNRAEEARVQLYRDAVVRKFTKKSRIQRF
jgi:hypothetical protein